jgi:hypothetical protein
VGYLTSLSVSKQYPSVVECSDPNEQKPFCDTDRHCRILTATVSSLTGKISNAVLYFAPNIIEIFPLAVGKMNSSTVWRLSNLEANFSGFLRKEVRDFQPPTSSTVFLKEIQLFFF